MNTMSESFFLNGPYAPMRKEGEMQDLSVIGNIPEDLNGTLFRQSASPQFDPIDPTRYHWFEGDGMIFAINPAGRQSAPAQPLCANRRLSRRTGRWPRALSLND